MPFVQPWPEEKIAWLKRLMSEGHRPSAIARIMRTTRNAIIGYQLRHGLNLGGDVAWAEDKEKRLRELHAQGLPDASIATLLGITRKAVNGKRERLGLRSNNPPKMTHAEFNKKRRELVAAGPARPRLDLLEIKPDAAEPAPVKDAGGKMFTLLTVTFNGCRWMRNDAGELCGHKVVGGSTAISHSYCAYHLYRKVLNPRGKVA